VFLQWAEYGLSVQKAIEEPRAVLSDGTSVNLEARISVETVRALRTKGHDVVLLPEFDMHVGGMQGVTRNPETGALFGGADPRRDGYAVGL
jgi:gamma-glutamyltranspeptidase/glutathione hydrolase